MLASNQPYHRVSDGIGTGLVVGGLTAAATAGAVHGFGAKAMTNLNKRSVRARGETQRKLPDVLDKYGADSKEFRAERKDIRSFEKLERGLAKGQKYHGKAFGGWKGMAATYGGSILAGAAVGGATDAIF